MRLILQFPLISTLLIIIVVVGLCNGSKKKQSETKQQHQPQTSDKPKILYLADSKYFSHFNLAVQMANTMKSLSDYQVDFVVADYSPTDKKLKVQPDAGINLIRVPVDDQKFVDEFLKKKEPIEDEEGEKAEPTKPVKKAAAGAFNDWSVEVFGSNQQSYWDLMRLRSVSLYNAIVMNPEVKVDGENTEPLLNYLRDQKYSLGMAEFGHLSSAFAVFHELNITKTIAVSATPLLPAFYHFLGLQIPATIPEHYTGKPGDGSGLSGIRDAKSDRQKENKAEYTRSIGIFTQIYTKDYKEYYAWAHKNAPQELKSVPNLSSLVHNVHNYFVNHHPLAAFPRPVLPKIKYIGGIEVEKTDKYSPEKIAAASAKKLMQTIKFSRKMHGRDRKHVEDLAQAECIVVFSLGTIVVFEGLAAEDVRKMMNAFAKHKQCHFIVRIDEDLAAKARKLERKPTHSNIHIVSYKKKIPQADLLALKSVKGLIHHCGQNSLTEALYAGVSMICIPFFGDQRYNAAIVEYLKVGLWTNHKTFGDTFPAQVDQLLKQGELLAHKTHDKNDYQKQAELVAAAIRNQASEQGNSQKDIFMKTV